MASRRRKTLSPSRVAALLRQSNQILGSLRDDDDENSYPVKKDDMSSGSSDGWDKDAASHDDGAFQPGSSGLKEGASGLRMSRLHSAVTCMWQGNKEQGRSTEGELWLSEGALHWTSAPMSDITNRAPTRDSCQPANGGFRIAMGDVESVRSVGDTRPTLEVKLTTMSDPVLLIFLGPGSVSAAMAAVEAFPVHLYQGKAPPTDAAALQSPPVDGPPMATAGDRAALPALIREFMVEAPHSARSRAIAREVHSLTGYPLLPFGVAPSRDAEPLPQRDLPLTDSQKRSLVMALMPLYECMNQARNQATKDSEALIDIRAERSDDGSYRYTDLSTQLPVSPNTYRVRYLRGLGCIPGSVESPCVRPVTPPQAVDAVPASGEVEGAGLAAEMDLEAPPEPTETRGEDESLFASDVEEGRDKAGDVPLGAAMDAILDDADVQVTSLEVFRAKAQERLFQAIDDAMNRYHEELARAEEAFRAAAI